MPGIASGLKVKGDIVEGGAGTKPRLPIFVESDSSRRVTAALVGLGGKQNVS